MTTTGKQLLRAILENPHDDEVRLVYSDWLEEQGKQNQAQFLRLEVELASGKYGCDQFMYSCGENLYWPKDKSSFCKNCKQYLTKNDQVMDLWAAKYVSYEEWFSTPFPCVLERGKTIQEGWIGGVEVLMVHRGFPFLWRTTMENFNKYAKEMFSLFPITKIDGIGRPSLRNAFSEKLVAQGRELANLSPSEGKQL